MKRTSRLEMFVVANIIILLIALTTVYFSYDNKAEYENENVLGVEQERFVEVIHNLPPSSIETNTVYDFSFYLYTTEGESIDNEIVGLQLPNWLFLEDNRLFGMPGEEDMGINKVELLLGEKRYMFEIFVY
jgi:hypothetical protein